MLAMYLAVLDDRSSEEQFIDVYNTYKRLVYHTAYKIMGDSYLAEDVLQEVFLYVAKNFSKIHRENCHELAAYETTQKFAGPPNKKNPNLFPIGEGFGFFVFFGYNNEGSRGRRKTLIPCHRP